jgi:hypothetical protein
MFQYDSSSILLLSNQAVDSFIGQVSGVTIGINLSAKNR